MKRGGLVGVVLSFALLACGDDDRELFVVQHDAGNDAAPGDGGPDALPDVDPTLGGPCTDDAQCDDKIDCTADRCDQTLSRCRNTPDDSLCEDGVYCNGKEKCILRQGCAPGPVVTCQDDNPCTVDRCIEATKSCEHNQRDVDGDGDPDDHCVGMKDCDDTDPTIASTYHEVCNNQKDDDCDGTTDESDCSAPEHDNCSNAAGVTAPGTYLLSTVAARRDFNSVCTVDFAGSSRDIVVKITAPAGGGPVNALVSARTSNPATDVAVGIIDTCTDPAPNQTLGITPLACGFISATHEARAVRRHLAAGATTYAVINAQTETAVDVSVDFLADADKPANETCATAQAIAAADLEKPFEVKLVDPAEDLATECALTRTGELVWSFDLTEARDVKIFASTTWGNGKPVVGLLDGSCTETRCRTGDILPVWGRNLAPGTHYFMVSGTSQIDTNIVVKTYAPTTPPAAQECMTAGVVSANSSTSIDLGLDEDEIKSTCSSGGQPAGAVRFDLTEDSDVLAIGRFSQIETGAVELFSAAACDKASSLACRAAPSPARVSKRNLPAGSYYAVISDEYGQVSKLDVLVRPYAVPTQVTTSNGCTDAITIPETGGFFTGDNTGAGADFDASCDAAGTPLGGAPDRILKFVLSQQRRVVFDMSGSFYTTTLDIRKGTACPGVEVPGACYVGFSASKSFLDLTLDAGTYWVQIDGYAEDYGQWNLDVRVLPP